PKLPIRFALASASIKGSGSGSVAIVSAGSSATCSPSDCSSSLSRLRALRDGPSSGGVSAPRGTGPRSTFEYLSLRDRRAMAGIMQRRVLRAPHRAPERHDRDRRDQRRHRRGEEELLRAPETA